MKRDRPDDFESILGKALTDDAYGHRASLDAEAIQQRISVIANRRSMPSQRAIAITAAVAATSVLLLVGSMSALNLGGRAPREADVPMFARGQAALQAGLNGELVLTHDGCLVLDYGQDRVLVAWPSPGTEWDPGTRTIRVDGVVAEVGDRVLLGGGFSDSPRDESDWANPPTDRCWQPRRYLAFGLEPIPGSSPSLP